MFQTVLLCQTMYEAIRWDSKAKDANMQEKTRTASNYIKTSPLNAGVCLQYQFLFSSDPFPLENELWIFDT